MKECFGKAVLMLSCKLHALGQKWGMCCQITDRWGNRCGCVSLTWLHTGDDWEMLLIWLLIANVQSLMSFFCCFLQGKRGEKSVGATERECVWPAVTRRYVLDCVTCLMCLITKWASRIQNWGALWMRQSNTANTPRHSHIYKKFKKKTLAHFSIQVFVTESRDLLIS